MSFTYRGTSSDTIPGLRAVLAELPVGGGVAKAFSSATGAYAQKLEPLELTFNLRLEAPNLQELLVRMQQLSKLVSYGDATPYSLYVNPIRDFPNGPWYYRAVGGEVVWERHKELWNGQFGTCVVAGELTFVCPSPLRRTDPTPVSISNNNVVIYNPDLSMRTSAIVRVGRVSLPTANDTLSVGSSFTIAGPLNTPQVEVDSYAGTVLNASGGSLVPQVKTFTRMRTQAAAASYGQVRTNSTNGSFGDVSVLVVREAW